MKLNQINSEMLCKLRNNEIIIMLTRGDEKVFYSKEQIGRYAGQTRLDAFNENLENNYGSEFDVVAVKKYDSQSEALGALLSHSDIKWDWTEESKQEIKLKEIINKLEEELKIAREKLQNIK